MDQGQRQNKIESIDSLPVPASLRKRTDKFCTFFNSIFVILLFIICVSVLNKDNLNKMTYPTDSAGTSCGFDNPNYPYLYFASLTDTSKRLCVSKCPKATDKALDCKPTATLSCSRNANPKYEVQIYDTDDSETRIGLICFPTNQDDKNNLIAESGLQNKYNFLGFYDAMWRSIWISVLFGLTSFLLVQYFPHRAVPWIIAIGGICSIAFGFIIMIVATGYVLVKLILFAVFCGLGVACGYSLFNQKRRESIWIATRLVYASTVIHSDRNSTERANIGKLFNSFLVILIFMGLFGILLVLIGFEILAVFSCGTITPQPDQPFPIVSGFGSVFLMILVCFEFIWGMSFLKEACNFVVSGYATQWYYNKDGAAPSYVESAKLLLKYHYGSVMGGSLLIIFFYFIDFAFNFLFPTDRVKNRDDDREGIDQDRTPEEKRTCTDFFSLIRTEAMAYINLINYPYCNASRYCEFLACESSFFHYSVASTRIFKISQHMIPIFFTVAIAIGSMKGSTGDSSPYGIFFITMISFFTTTYLLSYHCDKMEGLMVSIYIEDALSLNAVENRLEKAPKILKIIYDEDIRDVYLEKGFKDLMLNELK